MGAMSGDRQVFISRVIGLPIVDAARRIEARRAEQEHAHQGADDRRDGDPAPEALPGLARADGGGHLVAPGQDADGGRQRNRRVEVWVY